jgi:hypothetical protein
METHTGYAPDGAANRTRLKMEDPFVPAGQRLPQLFGDGLGLGE